MNKLLVILILSGALVLDANAQALVAGVKGIYNSTWLLNNNVSETAGVDQTYVPSFGYSYGLSGALFFSKSFGVEMNLLYATHTQQYEGSQIDYTSETSLKKIDVPLMLKFKTKTKVYVELGIQYALVSKANYYYDQPPLVKYDENISDKISRSSIDAVGGAGIELDMFLGFAFNAGIRLTYSLTDLDGDGDMDISDPLNLNSYYAVENEPTHSLTAGFAAGITYSIGRKE